MAERELRISVPIRDYFKKIIKSFTFLTQEEEGSKDQNSCSTAIISLPPNIQKGFKLKTVSSHFSGTFSNVSPHLAFHRVLTLRGELKISKQYLWLLKILVNSFKMSYY